MLTRKCRAHYQVEQGPRLEAQNQKVGIVQGVSHKTYLWKTASFTDHLCESRYKHTDGTPSQS